VSGIAVIPFRPGLAGEFRRLNLEWIERLFKVEAADLKVLDDPEKAIIEPGGMIFFALDGDAVVGTAAMIPAGRERCELAKMAVATSHQRRGIGELLGRACVGWAATAGVRSVFLRSNSRLHDAIRLYERLGFRHAPWLQDSDYARCDVYMELAIQAGGR
jgi:GNAT superfamily N-acetyltransferase